MNRCPKCNSEMTPQQVAGANVTGCHVCGGTWFEGDALTQLVRQHPTELARIDAHFGTQWSSTALDRDVPVCANCGADMLPREFKQAPGLPMRACLQCKSLWLADGQLTQLQEILAPSARSDTETPATHPCPGCGEKNPPEAPSCWACGKVFQAAPPPPPQETGPAPPPVPPTGPSRSPSTSAGGAGLQGTLPGPALVGPLRRGRRHRCIGRLDRPGGRRCSCGGN